MTRPQDTTRLTRTGLGWAAAGACLAAIVVARGSTAEQTPSPPTTATTSTVEPTPTEKIGPSGGNLFIFNVIAPGVGGQPTVAPGEHPGLNGVP